MFERYLALWGLAPDGAPIVTPRALVEKSGIERRRLLDWIIAWTGLSAAWILADGSDPWVDLKVLELAIAEARRG